MELPKRPISKDKVQAEIGFMLYSEKRRTYFKGFVFGFDTYSSQSRAKIFDNLDEANQVARKLDLEVQKVIELK